MSETGGSSIEREDGASGGAYRRADRRARCAEMTFSRASERLIIIDHTEVPDALRGRGVGNLLLERAIADARERGREDLSALPLRRGAVPQASRISGRAFEMSAVARRAGEPVRIADVVRAAQPFDRDDALVRQPRRTARSSTSRSTPPI